MSEVEPPQPPMSLAAPNSAVSNETPPRPLPVVAVWARDLLVSLAISAFIIIFLYQPVKVEGTSMMPGLEDQERIFVNKFVYRWEPIQRGDIVVFRYPRDTSKSYIKRVIGIAGDRIRIDIPGRTIELLVSDEELARRRAAMDAKGKAGWKPAKPRKRNVSAALRAYAAFATSAARGAVRVVP